MTLTQQEMTVPVLLRDYWHESISREEAIGRLRGRPGLEQDAQRRLEERIPPETDHYLTFHGDAFREYVKFSDHEVGHLLLILPLRHEDDRWVVPVPIYHSERRGDGRTRPLVGIEEHEFWRDGEGLVGEGLRKDTFRFETGPTRLMLDVSFATPVKEDRHPHDGCCGACEWVHSALDIHCADWICCLGFCD